MIKLRTEKLDVFILPFIKNVTDDLTNPLDSLAN